MKNYFLKNSFFFKLISMLWLKIFCVSSVAIGFSQITLLKLLCLGICLKRGSTLYASTFQNCLTVQLPSNPTLVRTCLGNVLTILLQAWQSQTERPTRCGLRCGNKPPTHPTLHERPTASEIPPLLFSFSRDCCLMSSLERRGPRTLRV